LTEEFFVGVDESFLPGRTAITQLRQLFDTFGFLDERTAISATGDVGCTIRKLVVGLEALRVSGIIEAHFLATGAAEIDFGVSNTADLQFDTKLGAYPGARGADTRLGVAPIRRLALYVLLLVARDIFDAASILLDCRLTDLSPRVDSALAAQHAAILGRPEILLFTAIRFFFGITILAAVGEIGA
jgi:hypothetical protein